MPYNILVRPGQWVGDLAPERAAPREGHWIARPEKARSFVQLGVCAGLVGQLPNLMHLILKPFLGEAGSWIAIFVAIAVLFLLAGTHVLRERRAKRMRLEDFAMVDGTFGDQYPAEVTIVADGIRLGTDRGVVWFADGLMGFSGRAAAFVLAPEDVMPRIAYLRQKGRARSVPPNAIVLRNAPKAAYVAVTPLGRHAIRYRSRMNAFLPGRGVTEDERLARYVMAPESASGERQWPPLEPYREADALVFRGEEG